MESPPCAFSTSNCHVPGLVGRLIAVIAGQLRICKGGEVLGLGVFQNKDLCDDYLATLQAAPSVMDGFLHDEFRWVSRDFLYGPRNFDVTGEKNREEGAMVDGQVGVARKVDVAVVQEAWL